MEDAFRYSNVHEIKSKEKRFSQEIIKMENTWLLLLLDVASIDQILRNINTQEAFFRLQKYAIKEKHVDLWNYIRLAI